MAPPLTKAERLAIGGAVAPIVRRAADAPRKVTVVGKDGKPVGETTSVEVAKAVLARSEIEFSVQPGKRPAVVSCSVCGYPVKVAPTGAIPKRCPIDAQTPCRRPASEEERAVDYDRIAQFAKERGLPEEWARKVYLAKHGGGLVAKETA
jgi:hypothetical protein